jgi:hypothetical protein
MITGLRRELQTGEKTMQIEHVGFYETRDGRLAYVLARLPDGANSEYQWAICCSDGEPFSCTDDGYYHSDRTYQLRNDLIRYLPTVKTWSDPILPPELPAVTVYTEWLSVGEDGNRWTGWTMDGAKPCYAVAKLRTVEVPANG